MSTDSDTRDLPIGIFDSGVGGLTVMRAITARLPAEDILYLGDTARVPYGNRSAETVRRYALNASSLLVERGIKALVVACNTASAHALDALADAYEIPILGVVEPVAARAAATSVARHVVVLGTRSTVRSQCYVDALRRLDDALRVDQIPCPLFVPLAEEGWTAGHVVDEIARHYLGGLAGTPADCVILGCTHYPLLRQSIASILDDLLASPPTLLDSARATADRLADLLAGEGIARADRLGAYRFFVTDAPDRFLTTADRFFGDSIDRAEHVDL